LARQIYVFPGPFATSVAMNNGGRNRALGLPERLWPAQRLIGRTRGATLPAKVFDLCKSAQLHTFDRAWKPGGGHSSFSGFHVPLSSLGNRGVSMRRRSFWAVFLPGLVLLLAAPFLRYLFAELFVRSVVSDATAPLQQAALQNQRRLEARARLVRARAAAESARYDLAPDQRCVGGAVVQVHGNEFTQVGNIARPVHCVGRRADRPLR
jgi:hypothetical protein